MTEEKLSWREKYAASLLLILGVFFLITQILDFTSSWSKRISADDKTLSIDIRQLKADLKVYFVILLAIIGGILLWFRKRIGWILGLPVLVWYTILIINGIIMSVKFSGYKSEFLFSCLGFILLSMAVGFLYAPSARKKYKVGKQTYLPTFLILGIIITIHFLL